MLHRWKTHHKVGATSLALVLVLLSIIVVSGTAARAATEDLTLAPAAPLTPIAIFQSGAVTVTWEAAQPGRYALSKYHVLRLNVNGLYSEVARVDAPSTTYIDNGGQQGDKYQLTASDDQDPANISQASDIAVATIVPPVSDAPSSTIVDDNLPKLQTSYNSSLEVPAGVTAQEIALPGVSSEQLAGPQLQNAVTAIDHMDDVHLAQLDEAVRKSQKTNIVSILSSYSSDKQQLNTRYTSLSTTDKAEAKHSCDQQSSLLETSLLNLPDAYQMYGLIALAECRIMADQP